MGSGSCCPRPDSASLRSAEGRSLRTPPGSDTPANRAGDGGCTPSDGPRLGPSPPSASRRSPGPATRPVLGWKRFAVGVLPRTPRLDVQRTGTTPVQPAPDRLDDELRPVVRPDVVRHAPHLDQGLQRRYHTELPGSLMLQWRGPMRGGREGLTTRPSSS